MSQILTWFGANWGLVASVLLGVSESLSLAFPSESGFGGILSGVIKGLKSIGTKPPP